MRHKFFSGVHRFSLSGESLLIVDHKVDRVIPLDNTCFRPTNAVSLHDHDFITDCAQRRHVHHGFRRAYPEIFPDRTEALERLISLGVDRLLTSGGAATAAEGADQIRALVAQANGRIVILPGGGITPENVARLVERTGVREVHFSVRDAAKVRKVVQALSAL